MCPRCVPLASAFTLLARARQARIVHNRGIGAGRDLGDCVQPALRLAKGVLDLEGQPKLSTGGVFTAISLRRWRRHTDIHCESHHRGGTRHFIDRICAIVKPEAPRIIAFDVVQGDPKSNQGGQHSHWGVVFGYFKLKGNLAHQIIAVYPSGH
jgi:hypothetical protein